jgi:SEC-C motif-containing protein
VDEACPCGRTGTFGASSYPQCCGRYLEPDSRQYLQAPDAESLMRSRYTAHTRARTDGASDYLLATWAPSHRPASLELDPDVTWLGLQVLAHQPDGDSAQVEFVARFREAGLGARQGPVRQLHERSRFVRLDGRWLYLDGA